MAFSVFIDGAAGTTGLEIRERLAGRKEFSLVVLEGEKRKEAAARAEALNSANFAILCLPDEAAKEAVALIDPASTVRVIDASSAHRVADGWTYGFPELIGREEVANARLVSNPGCYPTGFLGLVVPLVRAGLLPASWPLSVNAVSGYSGGGNALIDRFKAEPAIAYRAYGLAMGHKHLREMQTYAGLEHAPVFAPAVVPTHRGMLVEVPLQLSALPSSASVEAVHETIATAYADTGKVVTVQPLGTAPAEILLATDNAPWDGLELSVFGSADGTQARLFARLDNLGKGASGAAVQNLNLMAGLPETAGLQL